MCGHGTIGTVTIALEHGLVTPRTEGVLVLDTPAGRVEAHYRREGARVEAHYRREGARVEAVRITNVPSFLAEAGVAGRVPRPRPALGGYRLWRQLLRDRRSAAGLRGDGDVLGSRVAGDEPRPARGLQPGGELRAPGRPVDRRRQSRDVDRRAPERRRPWGRNAVFYGSGALDRSPCGTGSSARMAQWAASGKLAPGDEFVHESIIGSLFRCRVESRTKVGEFDAIVPSIEGWARVTGLNTVFVDEADPFAHGFQVT